MSIPAPWTDNALYNAPIKMADTLYGHFFAQQKRDAERAYQKMSTKEKVDFKCKTAEIDKAGKDDWQSPPPSLTPVKLTFNYCFKLLFLSTYVF